MALLWSAPYCSNNFSTNLLLLWSKNLKILPLSQGLPLPLPLPLPLSLSQPLPLPLHFPLPKISPSDISNNVSEPTEYGVSCFFVQEFLFLQSNVAKVFGIFSLPRDGIVQNF